MNLTKKQIEYLKTESTRPAWGQIKGAMFNQVMEELRAQETRSGNDTMITETETFEYVLDLKLKFEIWLDEVLNEQDTKASEEAENELDEMM